MRILIFFKISGSAYFVGLTVRVYQELLYGQHTINRWYVDKNGFTPNCVGQRPATLQHSHSSWSRVPEVNFLKINCNYWLQQRDSNQRLDHSARLMSVVRSAQANQVLLGKITKQKEITPIPFLDSVSLQICKLSPFSIQNISATGHVSHNSSEQLARTT